MSAATFHPWQQAPLQLSSHHELSHHPVRKCQPSEVLCQLDPLYSPDIQLFRCRFMSLVHDLIVGTLDASQYEDACRALLGELTSCMDMT